MHPKQAENYKVCNVLTSLNGDMSQKRVLCWEDIFETSEITKILFMLGIVNQNGLTYPDNHVRIFVEQVWTENMYF